MTKYELGDVGKIQEMLGDSVDISKAAAETDIEQINYLAFELYKESSILLGTLANIAESSDDEVKGVPRNQAICVGLFIHISKLMLGVVQLASARKRGEIIQTLNRCIMEPTINLAYLIITDKPEHYDNFVAYSFGPERELYDHIHANIQKNGGVVKPIETRMLASIDQKCKISGIDINVVATKHREWTVNMRERLKAIDRPDLYIVYRTLSHSIHGTWMEVLMNDLEHDAKTGMFTPRNELLNVDARILIPVARLALDAAALYLQKFFTPLPAARFVMDRIENQIARLHQVDDAHERLFSAR